PAPTSVYPPPLHDALPIYRDGHRLHQLPEAAVRSHRMRARPQSTLVDSGSRELRWTRALPWGLGRLSAHSMRSAAGNMTFPLLPDRKSTRLNSSHVSTSYA